MAKIKVVRVIARLNIGGPAIHTILLTARLDPARFESLLVTGSVADYEGDMLPLAEAYGVRPVIIPALGREINPLKDLRVLWQLYRLMRREKPQVVHTHTAKAGFVGRLAAWLAGVPVIVHTFHGHVFHSYFSPAKTRLFLFLERLMARVSTRIITISASQKHEIGGFGIAPPNKFVVIPLGFDLAALRDSAKHRGELRAELGIASDTKLVGIVARLTSVKNHRLFLEAARLVIMERSAGMPAVKFVIVGGGELEDELRAYARELGIAEAVIWLGWRNDVARVYADLDVVALTSLNEGTPVSLIEAMAAGAPLAATRVGGVADIVGEYGVLTPSGDAAAFAAALRDVVEHEAAARARAAAGRDAIYERFAAERLVGDVARLYEELLREA